MEADLFTELPSVKKLQPEWATLASAAAKPYSQPEWMLAWWDHVRPPGTELRVVAVREQGELVGLAPFFSLKGRDRLVRFRLLGSRTSLRTEPLALPGKEEEVGALLGATLKLAEPPPDLVLLEGMSSFPSWERLLGQDEGWLALEDNVIPAPVLPLQGSFAGWLETKSANFRKEARRDRRRLLELGAVFRMSTAEQADKDIASFLRLHKARWEPRGGSATIEPRTEAMLYQAGPELIGSEKMRLWCLDVGEETVAARIMLASGGEVSCWLGGFDPEFARYHVSLQTLLEAIEDAFNRGDRRLDLGGGGQAYKYRFSQEEELLRTWTLVPQGRRATVARLRAETTRLRRKLSNHLPEDLRKSLRSWVSPRT